MRYWNVQHALNIGGALTMTIYVYLLVMPTTENEYGPKRSLLHLELKSCGFVREDKMPGAGIKHNEDDFPTPCFDEFLIYISSLLYIINKKKRSGILIVNLHIS